MPIRRCRVAVVFFSEIDSIVTRANLEMFDMASWWYRREDDMLELMHAEVQSVVPDTVIVDTRGSMDMVATARKLKEQLPECVIMVLDDRECADQEGDIMWVPRRMETLQAVLNDRYKGR